MQSQSLGIYCSDSYNPYYNLALESALFYGNSYDQDFLIFFWRNDATVIVGKNQNPYIECDLSVTRENNILLARRITGGGAVFHDRGNLNYSFISKGLHVDKAVYSDIICKALVQLGIDATISGRNDIEVSGYKVSGSASRTEKERFLYHGCILVKTDIDMLNRVLNVNVLKLQSKGILSARSRVRNLSAFIPSVCVERVMEAIEREFCSAFDIDGKDIFRLCKDNICKKHEAHGLIDRYIKKYSDASWIYGRDVAEDIVLNKRFVWGSVQIYKSTRDGLNSIPIIYTDSIEPEIFETINNSLVGVPIKKNELINAIMRIDDSGNSDLRIIKNDICEMLEEGF